MKIFLESSAADAVVFIAASPAHPCGGPGGSARIHHCLRLIFMTFCAFALAALPQIGRAASGRMQFDIPGGPASESLRQFSAQTGDDVRLLYAADVVEGVRTKAVRGEMTPNEALNLVLADTPLQATQDPATGALVVAGRESLRRADPPRPPSRPVPTPEARSNTMNRKNPLALLVGWIARTVGVSPATNAAIANPAGGGAVQTGAAVIGQVSNAATHASLEGAFVTIAGTNHTAITDREGRYEFTALPAGPVTLEVSYTGLTTQRITVMVSAGQRTVRNVELTSDIYLMDAFTVAGIREGQAAAITQQRNAPNVKNVTAADAFGNVADGNAAEVLRLLPGIAAFNSENEARYIMVRGIDANLNTVTIDGMKTATGGAGANRQTDLPGIPIGATQVIEVTKSPTPDMDGDSIGGNINFRPASIFDRTEPRRITFAVSGSGRKVGAGARSTAYVSNKISPTYAFGYSNVFGQNQNIGVTVNLSHTVNWAPGGGVLLNGYQTTAAKPAFMRSLTEYDYHYLERTRSSVDMRLDYKVSDNSRLYFSSFYTYYNSEQTFHGGNNTVSSANFAIATLDASGRPIPFQPQFPFGDPNYRPGGFNAAGARVQASIVPGFTDKVTELASANYSFQNAPIHALTKRYSFQAGGRQQFGRLELDYTGNYQESPSQTGQKDWNPNATRGYTISVPNTSWRLDGTSAGSVSRRNAIQTGGPDVRDPANWVLSGLSAAVTDQGTNIFGGQLNLKLSFPNPVPSYIKTGFKYMSEERYTRGPTKTFIYSGPQGAFLSSFIDDSLPTGVALSKWHPFGMSPRYLDLDKINQYLEKNPQYLTHNAATSLQNELANDKNAREQVFAGYAMGNMSLGPLSVLGGVRFEKTHLSGETAIQDPRAGLTLTDPIERTRAQWGKRTTVIREYRNVLPGIHFKYAPGKNWLTRASYSQSFGRPSFGSIYPDTRINYDAERITQNNTGVKPQDAANFDVTIERYFEPIGVISAGVFLKEIKNFIFSNVVKIPTGSDNGFDGEYAGWDLATQANGGFARIKGAELNYSQQLSFLPGFWKGFGVFANHTWLETTGNYGRVTEPAGSALVNFTPRAANAGISYSRGRFYARVNVNYTGTYLRSYNLDPLSRSYQDRRTMVDTKLGFHYSRRLTLFTDVLNLFNSKQKWYSGLYRDYNTDQRDHGVRVQAGVNGSF